MRINKFVAQATGLSRRAADQAIAEGRVKINNEPIQPGQAVAASDTVTLNNKPLATNIAPQTILLNKPPGYVVSRAGQGSKTIYDLLPTQLHHLKPVGRLDKNSSGLLLLTNDGELAQQLTHPKFRKNKIYEIDLNRALRPEDWKRITQQGVQLSDGLSKFQLSDRANNGRQWVATLQEGRNRQIRRTFNALGYKITNLHRTHFGNYQLNDLQSGSFTNQT